jgi:cytoskeletal protein CcmA (bactofilin family)
MCVTFYTLECTIKVVGSMSERIVPPRTKATLGSVEGDLQVGRMAVVEGAGTPPRVAVSGTVFAEDNCVFECSLSAENFDGEGDAKINGDLEVKNRVTVDDGSLRISGNMTAKRVRVDRKLVVDKRFEVDEVDVGGGLEVNGDTNARKVDIGGAFTARGNVKAECIDVGGSMKVESEVDVEDIDVGGAVKVRGGRIGRVDVGGSFVSNGSLEFENIDVGGTVKLAEKSVGGNIDVGGTCKYGGTLKFGDIDVGGLVSITGSAEGDNLDVGGTVQVRGDLKLSGTMDVGGKVEVDYELAARRVDVGGRLQARKVVVEERVSVGGSIVTVDGVQAPKVRIGRRGEVRGSIRASEVVIGEKARVEDVYAKTITLERGTTARNLYGERISLESHCHILGEIQYTENLETERGVTFSRTPQKVDKLPSDAE